MSSSYGLIEVSGVVAAVDSLDAMCKAADVSLVTWERKLGGRLVTIIVEGYVSDVKAAVEAAKNICLVNNHIMASSGVIAAPCEETRKQVARSAKRIQKNQEQEKTSEDKNLEPIDLEPKKEEKTLETKKVEQKNKKHKK